MDQKLVFFGTAALSICAIVLSVVVLKKHEDDRLESDVKSAIEATQLVLDKQGRTPNSVRVTGGEDSGYKCSVDLGSAGYRIGNGSSPMGACLNLIAAI